jgi:hypothetical protein
MPRCSLRSAASRSAKSAVRHRICTVGFLFCLLKHVATLLILTNALRLCVRCCERVSRARSGRRSATVCLVSTTHARNRVAVQRRARFQPVVSVGKFHLFANNNKQFFSKLFGHWCNRVGRIVDCENCLNGIFFTVIKFSRSSQISVRMSIFDLETLEKLANLSGSDINAVGRGMVKKSLNSYHEPTSKKRSADAATQIGTIYCRTFLSHGVTHRNRGRLHEGG